MNPVGAVIFDVYGTLLEVSPPATPAHEAWRGLWRQYFSPQVRLSHGEFTGECGRAIAREHARARALGIGHPEVLWPDIVSEVLPEWDALDPGLRERFILDQVHLERSVRLGAGADAVLRWLAGKGIPSGIASNSQAYTRSELESALASAGLRLGIFVPSLCFWSFEHGYSKPDPHVFRHLTARLRSQGVTAAGTLMVGDRLDNDIEPARGFGWQTWHLGREPERIWDALARALKAAG